jgi:hypothetical protein
MGSGQYKVVAPPIPQPVRSYDLLSTAQATGTVRAGRVSALLDATEMPSGVAEVARIEAAGRAPIPSGDETQIDPGDPNNEWIRGLTWEALPCESGPALYAWCESDDNIDPESKPSNPQYDPPEAVAAVVCSGLGDWEHVTAVNLRNALTLLDVCQHGQVAGELWTGTLAQAQTPDLPNDYLANNPDEIAGGQLTANVDALSALDEALAGLSENGCGCGARGWIHAPIPVVNDWLFAKLLRTDGTLYYSPAGNIVVTGPGYDGSSPEGDIDESGLTAWVYATGPVDIRLGAPKLTPNSAPQGFDLELNTFALWASRPFAATFAPCCHLGINVNIEREPIVS